MHVLRRFGWLVHPTKCCGVSQAVQAFQALGTKAAFGLTLPRSRFLCPCHGTAYSRRRGGSGFRPCAGPGAASGPLSRLGFLYLDLYGSRDQHPHAGLGGRGRFPSPGRPHRQAGTALLLGRLGSGRRGGSGFFLYSMGLPPGLPSWRTGSKYPRFWISVRSPGRLPACLTSKDGRGPRLRGRRRHGLKTPRHAGSAAEEAHPGQATSPERDRALPSESRRRAISSQHLKRPCRPRPLRLLAG